MSSLEKYVQKIHKKLNNESLEEQKIKKYLHELDRLEITLDILKATGIGRAVNRYRKHGSSVGDIASCLVTKWKELLKHGPNHCSQSKSSNGEDIGVFHLTSNHINHTCIQNDGADTLSGVEAEMGHVDNQDVHVRSRHKIGETKSKARSAPQLCDVSFGCEPVVVKQKKRPTTTASAAASTKMTSSDSIRSELQLPALPSSLSVNKSLLPEIQPSYKPIRVPDFGNMCTSPKKKKGVVGTELDAHALMSRKSRTQVFSGRKSAPTEGVVPSLFVLAMKVLIENVDALDDTGGVPYDILHPVLEKCNPQQLLHLEECNPYFIEDTESLWERHCWRDFKGTKPVRNQTWRELYMKNEGEREERLKKINEKISASQKAKRPERQVQLAYVTTEAKPPREVRRKQAKFGTGSGVHPSVPVAAPSRSVPQAHHRNLGSSPAKKQAVPAPMMKKTMKLFKTQRSRANTSIRRT